MMNNKTKETEDKKKKKRKEELYDETLNDSFPASDPPSEATPHKKKVKKLSLG